MAFLETFIFSRVFWPLAQLSRSCMSILEISSWSKIFFNLQSLGTIHLRRRHCLGGKGSKIGQICLKTVVKNCQREGGRGQKSWKFVDVLNGWSLASFLRPYFHLFCHYILRFFCRIYMSSLQKATLLVSFIFERDSSEGNV